MLNKTKFGYEVRATGFNKEAARYAGMNEKRNIILTLVVGGALAGAGAAFLYLTGYLDKSMYPSQIADLITSIIIYLCGFVLFFKLTLTKSLINRRDKKK